MSSSLLQSTLFLLIPLFSIAIIVLALSHTPGPLSPQAMHAYIYIASVTLLSTLAGVLPLFHSSNSLSEHLIQALLFLFISIPVLHLPPAYVPNLSIRTLHTSILVITLSIATLLALITPFLPAATPLIYIPPSLYLLYTIQAIPRIAYILHNFLCPEDSNTIPLTLPSPASTASFPSSTDEIRKHHKIPSVSTTSTITIVDRTRISFPRRPRQQEQYQEQEPNDDQLRSQILYSRSRSLLVFIFAVQIAALVANACALGVAIAGSNTLKTVQTACTVLAVTGSMSAYLLHTYNLHLQQTSTPNSNYNNLSAHLPDQLQMVESHQHHPDSHSPMLIQLEPPPLAKARRKRANAGVSIEKIPFRRMNDEKNTKRATSTELELDVVMDISRYSMTLGRGLRLGGGTTTTELGSGKKDSIDLGLALVSSPACTPVPVPLPVPPPLRVTVEEGSRCGGGGGGGGGGGDGAAALEKRKEREREKIQGYYLSSSSSTSVGSPFSPFEHCGMETETDPSSPDSPFLNLHSYPNTSGSPDPCGDDAALGAANANTIAHTRAQVKKHSSFFGWEFAWDQEALERADDAGKLRSAIGGGGGGSPVRWKSDVNINAKLNTDALNPSTADQAYSSTKIQPLVIVDDESFMEPCEDREPSGPSLSLSRPHSLSSDVEAGGGRVKRGMSWRSSVCGVVGAGEEKAKRKNTLGLGIKPLRLSRSFGGNSNRNSNTSGGHGSGTRNGRGMGHRTILSGDTGPMCGLSLKRKATVLIGGQGSPVSPVSGSAISSRVMRQGQEDGDGTGTKIAAAPTPPKRLKKKTKPPGLAAAGTTGMSPSAESEIGERNKSIDNHSTGSIHGDIRILGSGGNELDEDANLQKTSTMISRTMTKSYPHSPQSYRYSPSSPPNQQQRREAATSESRCSSIDESCITTTTTNTTAATNAVTIANTDSPTKLSPSLTRRGLSLKRSFKMGSTVGRTLGPGLTLSSSGSGSGPPLTLGLTSASAWPYAHRSIRRCESEGFGFKEDEKRECEEKEKRVQKKFKENLEGEKVEEEDLDVEVEVEAEMRSLVAARLVSASYVRAAPATIVLTPATGADGRGGGGYASGSSGSGNPVKYTTMPKSTLHSRPSLPIMNTTTSGSVATRSTTTQQYQDVYKSSFSTSASRRHGHNALKAQPFADSPRPSEASNARGDDDAVSLGQKMGIIRRSSRGNDNDTISSPPLLPLPPLLLPPRTPPSQSQSLPPTPIKSRSTLLIKPSINSFKKRSTPPALPAPPKSSEWALFPHSMLTTNGVGGAAASMVSLAHSSSHPVSQSIVGPGQTVLRPPPEPPSRPTTPRPSTRLSAVNIGTVRSAFAGVGAKVSARMSINSASTRGSAGAAAGNAVASSMGMEMDDFDGDFMDLRDPFASPPPSKVTSVFRGGDYAAGGGGDFWISERAMSSLGGGAAGYDDDDDVEVGVGRRISSVSGGKRRVNMNAWGRLPMPSILPGSAPETSSSSVSSLVASRKKAHSHRGDRRKYKEKRDRKAAAADSDVLGETHSSLHGYTAPSSAYNAGEEDADFDVEEALLSQRLLRRLDSIEWD